MPSRKVYAASLGFYDTVIAAPSKTSALAAWGAKYDLFKYGGAHLESDSEVVKAAMAKPGVVLRRPVGSNEPFSEDPNMPSAETLKREMTKRASAFDGLRKAAKSTTRKAKKITTIKSKASKSSPTRP